MTDHLTEYLDQLDRDADFYAGNNVSVMQLTTDEVKALVDVARALEYWQKSTPTDATGKFDPYNQPQAVAVEAALARLAAAAKGGET